MGKFSIGDRVRIIRSNVPRMIGVETTIASDLHPCNFSKRSGWYGFIPNGTLVYDLEIKPKKSSSRAVVYPPDYLEPINDDDDQAAWDETRKIITRLQSGVGVVT